MIRELIDTELESVAGGLDLSAPYVTLNNVGSPAIQLNLQPQTPGVWVPRAPVISLTDGKTILHQHESVRHFPAGSGHWHQYVVKKQEAGWA